jgi:hypothetical protein
MKKGTKSMKEEECDCDNCCGCCGYHGRLYHREKMGGGVYGLGFVGAAIYYISNATGFWMGVLGVLKAIVWPAILVYSALKSFGI